MIFQGTSTNLLGNMIPVVTELVNGAIDWIGSFVTCITSQGNELLLMFVVMGFVGLAIGLIRRIISLG